ncbi:MAG: hypothetical protein HY236_08745 [Acidobacteria bacterium]|nr:hypothetical protein [Acidobacteriota bacterium]
MNTSGPLKNATWALAGAALLGGGMYLGFASSLVRRRKQFLAVPVPGPDPVLTRRVDELVLAIAELQKRSEDGRPQPELSDRLDGVTLRVEQLEHRLEQWANEPLALPPIDQVLAAVEKMVAERIDGLDERLSDQVHAIELLRNASAQTDVLLQKLITAVETLAGQAAEKRATVQPENDQSGIESLLEREYPVA